MRTGALCGALLAMSAISATADDRPGSEAEMRAAESRYLEGVQKIDVNAAEARRREFEKLRESYRLIVESTRGTEPPASPPQPGEEVQPTPNQSVFSDARGIWSTLEVISDQPLATQCALGLVVVAVAISLAVLAIIVAARRRVIKTAPEFCRGGVKVRLGSFRIDPKAPRQLIPTRRGSLRFSLREPWLVQVSFNLFFKKSGRYVLCCHWGLRQWDLIGVHGAERHIPGSKKHEA
jgi:hypothetical protein